MERAIAALLAATLALSGTLSFSASAADAKFFDDGALALVGAVRPGIVEPSVPVFHNGNPVGSFNVVEAYDQVPGTSSFPLTAAHLVANTYQRFTYQNADGTSGALGSSVIGTPSFRTTSGLQLVPSISRADVTTGFSELYSVSLQGNFGSLASITSTVHFSDPGIRQSTARMDLSFSALSNIALATASPFPGNDRFRLTTVSSMFASATQYDANVIRYEDPLGATHTFALSDATPRDAHLFAAPLEIGSWFELIKTPGSTWFPDSPSIRISVLNSAGLRLGLQGFLAGSTNPNDDSLSVWAEWLDAPAIVTAGTNLNVGFQILAAPVPEPATYVMMLLGLAAVCFGTARNRHRA